MKRILFLLILFSTVLGRAQKVIGPITTNGPADTYPTHYDTLGFGGTRVVQDATARNAIPEQRRTENMVVILRSDNSWWQLIGGLTDEYWTKVSFGSTSLAWDSISGKPNNGSFIYNQSSIPQTGSLNITGTGVFGSYIQVGNNILDPSTTNNGGIYYSTLNNTFRGATNGVWKDLLMDANNGLTATNGTVQLGGEINQDTYLHGSPGQKIVIDSIELDHYTRWQQFGDNQTAEFKQYNGTILAKVTDYNTQITNSWQVGYRNISMSSIGAGFYSTARRHGLYVYRDSAVFEANAGINDFRVRMLDKKTSLLSTDSLTAVDTKGQFFKVAPNQISSTYTLPTASATTLGGIKIGTGLSINATTGVLTNTVQDTHIGNTDLTLTGNRLLTLGSNYLMFYRNASNRFALMNNVFFNEQFDAVNGYYNYMEQSNTPSMSKTYIINSDNSNGQAKLEMTSQTGSGAVELSAGIIGSGATQTYNTIYLNNSGILLQAENTKGIYINGTAASGSRLQGDIIFDNYDTARNDGTTTKAFYVGVDGYLKYGSISGAGGGSADGNNYPTALSFNTSTKILSLSRNGLSDITADLSSLGGSGGTPAWTDITGKPNSGNFIYNQFGATQDASWQISGRTFVTRSIGGAEVPNYGVDGATATSTYYQLVGGNSGYSTNYIYANSNILSLIGYGGQYSVYGMAALSNNLVVGNVSGITGSAAATESKVSVNSGTSVNSLFNLNISTVMDASSTVANYYSLYIDGIQGGGTNSQIGNYWGIFQVGGAKNYFAGKIGVGVDPTYPLDVNGNGRFSGGKVYGSGSTDSYVSIESGQTYIYTATGGALYVYNGGLLYNNYGDLFKISNTTGDLYTKGYIKADGITYNNSSSLKMLVQDTTTGQFYRQVIPSGGSGGSSYTFNNGLTETSGTVKLGGTLALNTTIANSGNSFTLSGTGTTTISTPLTISHPNILLSSFGNGVAQGILGVDLSHNLITIQPTLLDDVNPNIFAANVSGQLRFRSIKAGAGIVAVQNTNDVTISTGENSVLVSDADYTATLRDENILFTGQTTTRTVGLPTGAAWDKKVLYIVNTSNSQTLSFSTTVYAGTFTVSGATTNSSRKLVYNYSDNKWYQIYVAGNQ